MAACLPFYVNGSLNVASVQCIISGYFFCDLFRGIMYIVLYEYCFLKYILHSVSDVLHFALLAFICRIISEVYCFLNDVLLKELSS